MTITTKQRVITRNQNSRNGVGVKQTITNSPEAVQVAGDADQKRVEQISPDLLRVLQSARTKLAMAQASADGILQEIVELYSIQSGDNLDILTGVITRKAKEK